MLFPSPLSISKTLLIIPKQNLCAHQAITLHFPPPLPGILLSVSTNLTIPGTSEEQNHTVSVLLCLAYFILHAFKVQGIRIAFPSMTE